MDKGPIGVIEEETPSSGDENKGPILGTKGKDPEGPVGMQVPVRTDIIHPVAQ